MTDLVHYCLIIKFATQNPYKIIYGLPKMLLKMNRHIIIALIVCLVATLSVNAQNPDPATDDNAYLALVDSAQTATNTGRYDDAARFLHRALSARPASPTNVLLLSNLGMVQHYAGRDSMAYTTLSSALAQAPGSITILMNRGKVLTSMGRYDAAIADFSSALRRDTSRMEPRFYRAMILIHTGEVLSADADADTLMWRSPRSRMALEAKSAALRAMSRFEEAIPLINELISHYPDAAAYGARAACRVMTDDLNGAASDVAEALSRQPENPDFILTRALLNKKRYRRDDALKDAEEAIRLGADPARVKAVLAL